MLIPKKLGKYEIKEQIGEGGTGMVYIGHDPYNNSDVAVKVALSDLLKETDADGSHRDLFFNEAHAAGMLQHPNILQVFDAGIDNDVCYIVMELVAGANTLKTYCAPENLLSYEQVVEIIFQCAKALDYAHCKGVVHRDIKPLNILITDDMQVKIGDFGIAHVLTPGADKSVITGIVGSPLYMSPEQARGTPPTAQTDLFSLGIVMYEMLTGKHPFSAGKLPELIHKILHQSPPPLRACRPDVPNILIKIIRRALQKDPNKRYKTGGDIASDLSLAFDFLRTLAKDLGAQEKFNIIESLDFFTDFEESEIWEIIHACIWQEFKADEDVLREGEIDDSLFIIISGTIGVYKGKSLITTLSKGACFGEMGYLVKTKRTATVIAQDDVSLIKLKGAVLDQLSPACQLRFSKTFIRELVRRVSETTEKYISKGRA